MSDNNYNFDPNFFMKLSQIGDGDDGSENITRELSFDVDENELLKELEALSTGSVSQPIPISAGKPIIKPQSTTGLVTSHNYNYSGVDDDLDVNVALTPEDENDPDLLAELSSILSVSPSPQDRAAELKKEILRLKREGDIEGAKAKLLELNLLEESNKPVVPEPEKQKPVSESENKKPDTLQSAQSKPTSQATSQVTSPKVSASDTQVYRDLFSKLQKQSALCQTISDFYTSANRRPDATLFIKRKQALDLELQKLRLMLKSQQPAPLSKIVNVTYEYVLSNPDVPEGQLQLSIGQLKVVLPRKFKLKDSEEYKMKVTYELSGLSELEITLTSEPFTTSGLTNNNLKVFVFKCNKKDLRVIKSVEYKKIRIEIYGETGFLFFKSSVLKSTTQCKLDRLLKDCTLKEEIDLFDVGDDGKKSALPSAKLCLVAKVKSPLTSDGFKQCTEKWTVIPGFGFSNHTLYSDLIPPSPVELGPISPVLTGKAPQSNTLADHIASFEVIEYELGILGQNQAGVMADPNLMDLQVALESLRDRIQMQVELGQISLEDYLNSVKESIGETKNRAIQAKREGDIQLAQKYVKYVDIMRKEVAEAEANIAHDSAPES